MPWAFKLCLAKVTRPSLLYMTVGLCMRCLHRLHGWVFWELLTALLINNYYKRNGLSTDPTYYFLSKWKISLLSLYSVPSIIQPILYPSIYRYTRKKYCRNRCKYNYYAVFRLSLLFDFQLLNDFHDTDINKVS